LPEKPAEARFAEKEVRCYYDQQADRERERLVALLRGERATGVL